MKIKVIPANEYSELYRASSRVGKELGREVLEPEFEQLDAAIKSNLVSAGLREDEDFELSLEWQETRHHCGILYSENAHCRQTLEQIQKALSILPSADEWVFHLASDSDLEVDCIIPELFILRGVAYIPETEADFATLFH